MNIYPESFPEERIQDPRRQAELAVFRQLQVSDTPGVALYEARGGAEGREMDFAIWLEDIARVGLQVKCGRYRVDRGTWYLNTPDGEERKPSPAKQSWESSLQLHHYLRERLPAGRNPFVVPILTFPDMEPCENIEVWSVQAGVRVMFGSETLVERLIEVLSTCRVYSPPTAEEVTEEVDLLVPGTMSAAAGTRETLDLQTRQVVIQSAQVVNIYTTRDQA